MATKISIILIALVALASAGRNKFQDSREFGYRAPFSNHHSEEEDKSYEFRYKIEDESEELAFGHKEEKSSGEVKGYYYVLLPDSRIQHVRYTANSEEGYVAHVSYEGSAEYDSYESPYERSRKNSKKSKRRNDRSREDSFERFKYRG